MKKQNKYDCMQIIQQTAVEWLIDQLIPKDQCNGIMDIIEDAKQMEKEQIINSIVQCSYEYKITHEEAEQYYNEHFKLN